MKKTNNINDDFENEEKNIKKDAFNNNKKAKSLFVVIVITVIIITVVFAILFTNKDRFETIETTTVSQPNNVVAEDGESYTFVGEDGKTYLATPDGSYLMDDSGTYKITDYKNISLFRTYSYGHDNGTKVSVELQEDGTYKMTSVFPSGIKTVATGKYVANNGFDAALDGLMSDDMNDLTEGLGIKQETANPNNLYYVILYWGETKDYNSDGTEVTYQIQEKTDEPAQQDEFALGDDIAEELIIYLDTESTVKQDKDGKSYYDISVIGYSCRNAVLFAPWSASGSMSASGVYYVEEDK